MDFLRKVKLKSKNYSDQCREQLESLVEVKPRSNNDYSGQCIKQMDLLMWSQDRPSLGVLFIGQEISIL